MASSYPGGIDSLPNPATSDSMAVVSHAGQHADANDAIEAIETELGTNPSGASASVKDRLDTLVVGPGSATDNALVRFDGTGKTVQSSGITVDDSNNISGVGTFASGAVTSSGAVQAAAASGFVVGSSGPRVMSGTGSPEGVVSAPVGSTWRDTDATTGAIKWIKASGTGNTGWVVEYGDTGARNLTTYWAPADIAVNSISIRRVNETIYVQGDVTLTTAYGTNTIGTSWPSGFTPASVLTTALDDLVVDTNGTVTAILLLRSNLFGIYRSPAPSSGTRWRFIKSWRTTDAWPSSLPGSAA